MKIFDKSRPLDCFLYDYNWREVLSNPPYSIKIKEERPRIHHTYALFKYNQFDSDMSYTVVQEARGAIYRIAKDEDGELVGWCVCRPFDKFFNYGEPYAAEIDWSTARVTEKVDGSLMKMWYDDGWHLSTNGTIDAFKAPVGEDSTITFGQIFERALGASIQTLGSYLKTSRTYMFELTSPETQIVVPYEDGVYYLASRSTLSGIECFTPPKFGDDVHIKFPKVYNLSNLDDVIAVVASMSKDQEGVVVNDSKGRRIKVKSPEYLVAARTQLKGYISERKIFQYIKEEKIDDFLGYAPEKKEAVDAIKKKISEYCARALEEWEEYNVWEDQKTFALKIKDNPYKGFLFAKKKNRDLLPSDYLFGLSRDNAYRAVGI